MDNIYVGEHYLFYYKSNEGRQGSSGNVKEKTTCSLSKECPCIYKMLSQNKIQIQKLVHKLVFHICLVKTVIMINSYKPDLSFRQERIVPFFFFLGGGLQKLHSMHKTLIFMGFRRGDGLQPYLQSFQRLILGLKPTTYRFGWKTLATAPRFDF